MDIEMILQSAARLFANRLGSTGGSLDQSSIVDALKSLLGNGGGGIDLAGLLSRMSSSTGLAAAASSWLGNGENARIDAGQIVDILGADKIKAFAALLGLDTAQATQGLVAAIPEIVDKASSGGLLETAGGLSGALGMAGKFFG